MATTKREKRTQGMNWIRKEKRFAIYLRDGMACCYCGSGVEDGERLTLDHLTPYSHGGSNKESNLVTACVRCNSSRGDRDLGEFVHAVAQYINHGVTAEEIMDHINIAVQRKLDVAEAKAIMARRGSWAAALKG